MFDQAVRTSAAPQRLNLRVVCTSLPSGSFGGYRNLTLGLQQGGELVPGRAQWLEGGTALVFECEVWVRRHRAFGEPEFSGPCVHGTGGISALHLVWEGSSGLDRVRFRRMKLSLAGISWERIHEASSRGLPLELQVSGVDDDGAPASGSVRLGKNGWQLPLVPA